MVPDIIRTDRGPEFVNRINQEFMNLLDVKHIKGAAMTPRHQGLCERNHQVMMANQIILMQAVTAAHPQEWPALLLVVEYVQATAPQGAHGFSAHDMSCAYAIVSDTDARLAPFKMPAGLPESEIVAKTFSAFKSIYGTFTRVNREASLAAITACNRNRNIRWFEEGETVFRKPPSAAKLPKHMFPPRNRGPYTVVSQPDKFNLV